MLDWVAPPVLPVIKFATIELGLAIARLADCMRNQLNLQ